MNNNESPGEDLITAEMFKAAQGDVGTDKIHELLQMVLDSEVCPDHLKQRNIIKLPKKGNLSDCIYWRGMTLLSAPDKVLAMIILECIYESLDGRINERQAGIRRGRSCIDQIFVLRNLIKQSVD